MKKTLNERINSVRKNVKWSQDGARFNKNGYIMIASKVEGHVTYAPEHVIIAERALGKPLPPGTRVYHVDGNGHNNNSYNLVVYDLKDQYHITLRDRTFDLFGSYESLRDKMRRWRADRKRFRQKKRKKVRVREMKGDPQ